MPVATVRGGRRLARFIQRASDPRVTDRVFAVVLARVVRLHVIPRLRSAVPRRTGRLARSFRVQVKGNQVGIYATWYHYFVRDASGRSPEEIAVDAVNDARPFIRRQLRLELRKAFGIG